MNTTYKPRWIEPYAPPYDCLIYGTVGDKGRYLQFYFEDINGIPVKTGMTFGIEPGGTYVAPASDGLVKVQIPDNFFTYPSSLFMQLRAKVGTTSEFTITPLQLYVAPNPGKVID